MALANVWMGGVSEKLIERGKGARAKGYENKDDANGIKKHFPFCSFLSFFLYTFILQMKVKFNENYLQRPRGGRGGRTGSQVIFPK